jgi:molecular chaperone Hsp33
MTCLFGEAMLGAFFLECAGSKSDAIKTCLHLEGTGPAQRIIAFASIEGRVRAHAGVPQAQWNGSLEEGKGPGFVKVSRWFSDSNIYTSSVEMRLAPIAKNLEDYLTRSDQVQAFVKIQTILGPDSEPERISGCMIQALPGASATDTDHALGWLGAAWPDLGREIDYKDGILSKSPFRTLGAGEFQFYCDCSLDRVSNMLLSLGEEAVQEIIKEHGLVEVFCEFCRERYEFRPEQIGTLFGHGK